MPSPDELNAVVCKGVPFRLMEPIFNLILIIDPHLPDKKQFGSSHGFYFYGKKKKSQLHNKLLV